jgi:hypothetical protein
LSGKTIEKSRAALATADAAKLAECETVIERGLQTFVEVGSALLIIRDNQLYRADYPTFHEYCRKRWDVSPSRAYQLIGASDITREISTIVDTPLPATESQARELVGLDRERAALVMRETANRVRGKITAKAIRATRERIVNPPSEPPPKPTLEPPKPEPPQPEPDPHRYCADESFFEQQAIAAWDRHPANPHAEDYLGHFGYVNNGFCWWFRELLDEHFLCFDPFLMAGSIASWLAHQRNADGVKVLESWAHEIGMADHVMTRDAIAANGGDSR